MTCRTQLDVNCTTLQCRLLGTLCAVVPSKRHLTGGRRTKFSECSAAGLVIGCFFMIWGASGHVTVRTALDWCEDDSDRQQNSDCVDPRRRRRLTTASIFVDDDHDDPGRPTFCSVVRTVQNFWFNGSCPFWDVTDQHDFSLWSLLITLTPDHSEYFSPEQRR